MVQIRVLLLSIWCCKSSRFNPFNQVVGSNKTIHSVNNAVQGKRVLIPLIRSLVQIYIFSADVTDEHTESFNPFNQVVGSNLLWNMKILLIFAMRFNPFNQVVGSNWAVFANCVKSDLWVLIPLIRSLVQIWQSIIHLWRR